MTFSCCCRGSRVCFQWRREPRLSVTKIYSDVQKLWRWSHGDCLKRQQYGSGRAMKQWLLFKQHVGLLYEVFLFFVSSRILHSSKTQGLRMKNHHRLPQGAPSSIWLQLTSCHRGCHQVYGCNLQAATGGAIKYVVATHRRPHGRHHCGSSGNQTAAWTTWNYGWAPSLASHCKFFFFLRGCSIPLSSRWRFRRLPVWPKPGANSGSFLTRGDVFESDKIWKMGIKTNRYHL